MSGLGHKWRAVARRHRAEFGLTVQDQLRELVIGVVAIVGAVVQAVFILVAAGAGS